MRLAIIFVLSCAALRLHSAGLPPALQDNEAPPLRLEGFSIPTIQIVKTYGALLKQPLIKFGKNPTVRFGIFSTTAPTGSGLLLYALTENYIPNRDRQGSDPENCMGPFRIQLFGGSEKLEKAKSDFQRGRQQDLPKNAGGKRFFCRLLPLAEPGEFTLTIHAAVENIEYARTEVTATLEPFHPWLPLGVPVSSDFDATPGTEKDTSGKEIPIFNIRANYHTQETVLPTWNTEEGYLLEKIEDEKSILLFKPEDPLPSPWLEQAPARAAAEPQKVDEARTALRPLLNTLKSERSEDRENAEAELFSSMKTDMAAVAVIAMVAQTETDPEARQRARHMVNTYDPVLSIEKSKDGVHFRLNFKRPYTMGKNLNDSFLVRWWVNGAPFVPDHQLRDLSGHMASLSDITVQFANLELNLDEFARRDLGVKPGDKLGMQLMYSPGGTQAAAIAEQLEHLQLPLHDDSSPEIPQPIISNRVDFIVPPLPEPPPDVIKEEPVLDP